MKNTTTFSQKRFINIENHPGIRKDVNSGSYIASKCIKGHRISKSFKKLSEAIHWKNTFCHLSKETQEDRNKIQEITDIKNKEINGIDKGYSLGDIWNLYCEQYINNLESTTRESKVYWSKFFESLFPLKIASINPETIDSLLKEQKKLSILLSSRRFNFDKPLKELKALFNWYKENYDYKFINPVLKRHRIIGTIKKSLIKNKKMTPNEINLFFQALSPFYRDFALVQFYSASRVSETAGLQTFNINLEERTYLIKHVVVWDRKKKFVELKPYPKNGEERLCVMNETLEEILVRKLKEVPKGCTYLFHQNALPLNYRAIQYEYTKALKQAGLAEKFSGTHIMRHTMATITRRVTGSLDSAQAVTGHKDLKLAQHYASQSPELQGKAVVSVERFMQKLVTKKKKETKEFTESTRTNAYKSEAI